MAPLATVVGYAVVVAFTTLPVLTVIAVLLDTGRPARGWQLTIGYAAGLTVLFVLAAFGLERVPLQRLRDAGGVEIVAGALLLVTAGALWLWHRHRANRPHPRAVHPSHTLRSMTARRAVLVGAQFAIHPENLALTFAAAAHVADLAATERLAAGLLFATVGVSTVALPTLAFGVAGDRTRDRLDRLRRGIIAHAFLLTEVVIVGCGLLLVGLGLWRLLDP